MVCWQRERSLRAQQAGSEAARRNRRRLAPPRVAEAWAFIWAIEKGLIAQSHIGGVSERLKGGRSGLKEHKRERSGTRFPAISNQ